MQRPNLRVSVVQLSHGKGLPLPCPATPHAAGMDLRAAIPEGECWTISPHERKLIPTGIALAIPSGYEGQVRPRSGLALKHGITVLNAPGTIDADYRNEIMVILINHGDSPFEVHRGDRIAQILFAPILSIEWNLTGELEDLGMTERGLGGYGSTGRN